VQYPGVIVFDEKTRAALASVSATEYGDTQWVTQPRFETGDSRYVWLNRVVSGRRGSHSRRHHGVPGLRMPRWFPPRRRQLDDATASRSGVTSVE
jgi:hypothetical protein